MGFPDFGSIASARSTTRASLSLWVLAARRAAFSARDFLGMTTSSPLAAIQFRAELGATLRETCSNKRLASAGSGLQLGLEIALSGSSSEGPAPSGFSARPKMRRNVE